MQGFVTGDFWLFAQDKTTAGMYCRIFSGKLTNTGLCFNRVTLTTGLRLG